MRLELQCPIRIGSGGLLVGLEEECVEVEVLSGGKGAEEPGGFGCIRTSRCTDSQSLTVVDVVSLGRIERLV